MLDTERTHDNDVGIDELQCAKNHRRVAQSR